MDDTIRLQPCGTFHADGEECGHTDTPCKRRSFLDDEPRFTIVKKGEES